LQVHYTLNLLLAILMVHLGLHCRQIPQYSIVGASEVFTYIGQLEFFYDQSPEGIRSLGSALALATFGLGNYLSSILVTGVTRLTTNGHNPGWIPADNLNRGHLDYFFWFLAALSLANLVFYTKCAQRYRISSAHQMPPIEEGVCVTTNGCPDHRCVTSQGRDNSPAS
jgi:peptide/histidine transporter 3/4